MMPNLPILLLSALVIEAQAVSFSSWRGLGCRGEDLEIDKGLYPYSCTFAGADASSIEASGLENSNNAQSYIEIYSDTNCKDYVSTIKHSGFCSNNNFQSVILFVPAISKTESTNRTEAIESEKRDVEEESHDLLAANTNLISRLDALRSYNSSQSSTWRPRGRTNALEVKVLPRADGDLHTYSGDSSYQGIEDTDDNSPGDSNGFTFSDTQQRDNWIVTLAQRMINYRNQHPGDQEYNGAQTVGNHDLEVTFVANEGTLGDFTNDELINYDQMFGTQRDGHSHQVWSLYHNHQLRATITLKAFRIG